MTMPKKLKILQNKLKSSGFQFITSGKRHLSDEVYPAVRDEFPQLCADETLCSEVCSGGNDQEEWKHRVRTVLHDLADNTDSRVTRIDAYGYWYFE
jgi:hypothetical protein